MIKMRPITDKDIINISSGYVNQVAPFNMKTYTTKTVVDPKLFGRVRRMDDEKQYDDSYLRTASMHLVIPVLNPFLAGEDGSTWKTLLNNDSVKDIMYGRKVYNIKEHKEYWYDDIDTNYRAGEWLIGGDYLSYLIDKLDVKKELIDILWETHIKKLLPGKLNDFVVKTGMKWSDLGTIRKVNDSELFIQDEDGDYTTHAGWLIDNFIFEPSDKFAEILKDSQSEMTVKDFYEKLDDRRDYINEELLHKANSRFTYLLAYERNPEQVKTQVLKSIFILPEGYRPTIDDRVDPLTTQYNQLVKYNNELLEAMNYASYTLSSILKRYERFVYQLVLIFTGKNDSNIRVADTYKSIVERLAGKQGLIRDKMQGVRMDYSARSVITCDPYMPLDCIGVPKKMLNKLIELDIIANVKNSKRSNSEKNMSYLTSDKYIKFMQDKGADIAKGEYILTGRQPTLFYLGIQALKVVPVDGNAIVLSPLVVMPFNADFDGDQMHFKWPVGIEAKEEVRKLIASTKNLRYPKNGEIHVVARHEILYGLWICTTVTKNEKARHWSETELSALAEKLNLKDTTKYIDIVYEGICRQEIAVYDFIDAKSAYSGDLSGKTAGIWAVKYALGKANSKYVVGVVPLRTYDDVCYMEDGKQVPAGTPGATAMKFKDKSAGKKWFNTMFASLNTDDETKFVNIVNKVVKLGFAVAKVWPPSITTLNDIDLSDLLDEFNAKISKREELLARGIEIESTYVNFFNTEYNNLRDAIRKKVIDELGEDNGYIKMWVSGAKGDDNNLLQIFGFKGRIMKDDVTAFNTIIRNALSDQLTDLEHFITAYGSRQGIVDKVLSTAEPGYLTRKLEHSAANCVIVAPDCGTSNGVLLRYDDILPFVNESKIVMPVFDRNDSDMDKYQKINDANCINCNYVEDIVVPMLIGRVILPGNIYVHTKKEAIDMFRTYVASNENGKFEKKEGILMRSPITCQCPCCQMCYGADVDKNTEFPKIGKPIGFIAAQSIGEPGTQLTMKNFQRGGVVSEANLTSSFDKINNYFHLYKLRKSTDLVLSYDALSPRKGYVKTLSLGDGRKKIIVTKTNKPTDIKNTLGITEYIVDENLQLKDFVNVGDSFQKLQGDLDVREIIKYRTTEEAYTYLILMLYATFNEEGTINLKHFETIVSSMLSFVISKGNGNYLTGEILSNIEYYQAINEGNSIVATTTLTGIKQLPKYRRDFFEALFMEDMKTFVRRASVVNPMDSMKNPKTRLSFGLNLGIGSDYEGYMD